MSERIGIYRDADGKTGFFAGDLAVTVVQILEASASVLGDGVDLVDEPAAETRAKHVGDIVVEAVTDPAEYLVKAGPQAVGKPTVKRKPEGAAGSWETQSVVFNRETHTLEQARAWLEEHDEYGDYGHDETEGSFRFRQYDPEHFSEFKTVAVTEGVSLVRGKVKGAAEGDEAKADAVAAADLARETVEAVWSVNRGIMAKGIQLLTRTVDVRKGDDGDEERFILGLVLEPNDGTNGAPMKPDTQDDVYSHDDVRKTAHGWMENYGQVDLMHSWRALDKEDVRVLESYLAPVEFTIGEGDDAYTVVKGTWLLGMRVVNDDLWSAVKESKIGAYSIGGTAERLPLAAEA